MSVIEDMMRLHPDSGRSSSELGGVVQALVECQTVCDACADACLAEQHVDRLRECIRLDQLCAELCGLVARQLLRSTSDSAAPAALLTACAEVARACAQECERHADLHEHCRLCAQTCFRAADACQGALAQLGFAVPAAG